MCSFSWSDLALGFNRPVRICIDSFTTVCTFPLKVGVYSRQPVVFDVPRWDRQVQLKWKQTTSSWWNVCWLSSGAESAASYWQRHVARHNWSRAQTHTHTHELIKCAFAQTLCKEGLKEMTPQLCIHRQSLIICPHVSYFAYWTGLYFSIQHVNNVSVRFLSSEFTKRIITACSLLVLHTPCCTPVSW